jgi:hypothetical protein
MLRNITYDDDNFIRPRTPKELRLLRQRTYISYAFLLVMLLISAFAVSLKGNPSSKQPQNMFRSTL